MTASPRPLRILTCLHSFEPGGVERIALRLHTAWRAAGHDARLVLGRRDGVMAAEWPGLDYELLGKPPFPTGRFETLWMIATLPRAIRRIRPDVLFCAGNTYTVVAVAMKILLGRRCPPVVVKISNDLVRRDIPAPARVFYRLWLRLQARLLDQFVGMAEPMRGEVATMLALPPEQVAIVEDPALDNALHARLAAIARTPQDQSQPQRFIAVGRLAGQKNFSLLLAAFAEMARPEDRLVILGEGSLRPRLEAEVRKLGIAGQVGMPGHRDPTDGWWAAATALVISSDYEGVPAVVAEALAAGLPIVATDCAVSMAELTGHGRFGLLVPKGDRTALAAAMRQIGSLSFEATAARAASRRFTVERAAATYTEEMTKLMAPSEAAGSHEPALAPIIGRDHLSHV